MKRIAQFISDFGRGVLNAGIPIVRPHIRAELPHDKSAFTQGLEFVDGKLFESTGLERASSVRRLCARTGKLELSRELRGHWGEGLAYQDGKIFQLTWKSRKVIVYRWPDLEVIGDCDYEGEGWGLTSMPGGFVMTDGSEKLVVRNAEFNISGTKRVMRKGYRMRWLNDLTYAGGNVYVNRLADQAVYEISLSSGKLQRIIDCRNLVNRAMPKTREDVLNGIGFDAKNNEFYMTGKRWPVIFRVTLPISGD